MSAGAAPGPESPASASTHAPRPWLIVGLLCFLYAASFLDRMILALLIDPIKADLLVSDTQLGFVFGTGFALFYVCAGLPLAHLADRGNRRRVLLAGVIIWSLSTVAAGFSVDFPTLLATRAGVAIGEAVLMPIAVSLIADLFPSGRRVLPTSIFSMVGAVMGSGALIAGSGALLLAIALERYLDIPAWRVTFWLVALPGLVGAALFAAMTKEPQRTDDDASQSDAVGAVVRHIVANARLYLGLFFGVAIMLIQAMGLVAWGPTMLTRAFGLSAAAAGSAFGAAAVTGALAGTLSVPLVLRTFGTEFPARSIVHAAIAYAALTAPILVLGLMSSQLLLVLAGIAFGMAGLAAGAVLPPLLAQAITPARMRARVVAFYLLINSLLSLGLGPPAVAIIAERYPEGGLATALAAVGAITLVLALGCYTAALAWQRQITKENC